MFIVGNVIGDTFIHLSFTIYRSTSVHKTLFLKLWKILNWCTTGRRATSNNVHDEY